MNILILCSGDKYSLGWSYKRGFESLGHEVQIIDPIQKLRDFYLWRNRLSRRIFERSIIENFNRRWLPELLQQPADLVWVGKGGWAVPRLWQQFKEHRPETKLICYNPDNPLFTYSRGSNRPWITESIGCFDLFCTYNAQLTGHLFEAGAQSVACIPFAWDSTIHPMHPYGDFKHDLLFIGNGDDYRAQWLSKILSSRAARRWRVGVFGVWSQRQCQSFSNVVNHKQIVGTNMAKLVASSRVTLNILRIQNEGSHNMRTFETPGCGGLLASQYSDEQAAFLNDNSDSAEGAIFFKDPADAVKQIAQAMDDVSRCQTLAETGRKRVLQHTYDIRAAQTLHILEEI